MSDSEKTISDQVPALEQLRRLGKNVNGYFGETIDIAAVLTDCAAAAHGHGWHIDQIPAGQNLTLLAFTRPARDATRHAPCVYISTGIHGDEPAGPLAVRQLLQQDAWPGRFNLFLLPCLNPAGFILNRRENPQGLDLNRQYLEPTAQETRAHIGWLKRQPRFDVCLCLHEDWESQGFYVYELNPDKEPSLAEAIVARVREVCPIDRSEIIEGRSAREGVIRPSVDPASRPQWPESFFLLTHKTRLSYTLEAPSDFPLPVRVAALTRSVQTALENFPAQPE